MKYTDYATLCSPKSKKIHGRQLVRLTAMLGTILKGRNIVLIRMVKKTLVGGFDSFKKYSQIGSSPHVGVKMQNIQNHLLEQGLPS